MDFAVAVSFPFADSINAAEPAANGVAIDVPLDSPNEPMLRGMVLRMFPPGAMTTRFRWVSNHQIKYIRRDTDEMA